MPQRLTYVPCLHLTIRPLMKRRAGHYGPSKMPDGVCELTMANEKLVGNDELRSSQGDKNLAGEESRIRAVYAERKRAIPGDRYSSNNLGNLCMRRELERYLLANLRKFDCGSLSSKKILDVGCGSGFWLHKVLEWGASPDRVCGVDLIEDRIALGRKELPKGVTLNAQSACALSFADDTFDLVLQFVMFSSILHDPTRRRIASEMTRVLKPGGFIIWYDFFWNNPWNPDVRGVRKKEIRELFPNCLPHFRRLTVAPPLTRRMGSLSPFLYPFIARLRVCCTHYLVLLQKPLKA